MTITDHLKNNLWNIPHISIRKNWKITTWNQWNMETLGSWPICPKISPYTRPQPQYTKGEAVFSQSSSCIPKTHDPTWSNNAQAKECIILEGPILGVGTNVESLYEINTYKYTFFEVFQAFWSIGNLNKSLFFYFLQGFMQQPSSPSDLWELTFVMILGALYIRAHLLEPISKPYASTKWECLDCLNGP